MARKNNNIEYIRLPNKDGWMITFSDMTNLLLTFFVMMIAFSTLDNQIFKESFGFFRQGVGVLDFPGEQRSKSIPKLAEASIIKIYVDPATLEKDILSKMPEDAMRKVQYASIDLLDVRQTPRGLAISLNTDVLFDTGSANLKLGTYAILSAIAGVIGKTDYEISVEGHTDNTGATEMNMNLSLRRGQAVLDYFIYVADMRPTRFCLAGYGPLMPFWHNDTELGRARNRRVEIVLLKDHI